MEKVMSSSSQAVSSFDGLKETFWKAVGCCSAGRSKDGMSSSIDAPLKSDPSFELKKKRPAFPAIYKSGSRILKVPSEYTTITQAVQKANPNDRIMIQPGIYRESILIEKSLELIGTGDDVIVKSTAATALTIEKSSENQVLAVSVRKINFQVDGGKGNFDHVVDNEGGTLFLEDCVLQGGYWGLLNSNAALAILSNNEIRDCCGYGVFTADRSTLWMENNDVYGHLLSGVNVQADRSLATLVDNKICNCKANGVMVCAQAQIVLENNVINDNGDAGISVCDIGTHAVIRRNTISKNGLVGVYCFDGASAEVENNDLRGNLHLAFSVHKDSADNVRCYGNTA